MADETEKAAGWRPSRLPVALLSRECCARGKKRQVQADATDDTRRVVERLTGLPYERCWR